MAKIILLPIYRMNYKSIDEMTNEELERRKLDMKDYSPGERWHLLQLWKEHKNKLADKQYVNYGK